MTRLKLIAGGALVLLLTAVCLQNTEAVDTRLLFITVSMPRIVLLAVAFLVGMIVGGILTHMALTKDG